MKLVRLAFSLFLTLVLGALASPVLAQKKDNQREIVIGHVAGYTGPVTKDATEMRDGAQVYFDSINAKGGVLNRKLRLLAVDDHFKPDETVQQITALKGKISALLPPVGSAQFDKVLKEGVLDKIDFPILGVIPGVESFRQPLRRNLFHFRAGDFDQISKMIDLTTSVGQTKIGVLATDNPNGEQVTAFMQESLARKNLKLVAVQKYAIGPKIDWAPIIKSYQQSQPDVIVLVGPPFATAAFIKEAKSAGVGSALYGLSYTDFRLTTKVAGNQLARGVAISQVFPNPANRVVPIIKEFRDNFEKYGKAQGVPSHFNLEGYLAAKILVEAIHRSKDASSAGVIRGLEMLHDWDMGGYVVDFSPSKHNGSRFVDMSIISGAGELIY
ncbi:MAG TPA: ABC transporter substrate-binding protein [Burkholderiales bacterium]|nr:ABC transporter substrate-binding protein [Burkholderiales bacterium]